MLVLQYVEQEEKVQGTKWGGLLPIPSFVLQHGRWCHDSKGCARPTGVPVSMRERRAHDKRHSHDRRCARVRVAKRDCRDKPSRVLYHDRRFYVATEIAHLIRDQSF